MTISIARDPGLWSGRAFRSWSPQYVLGRSARCSASRRRGLLGTDATGTILVDLCALVGTLVIDPDGVYDPRLVNDRLLLGLKGTMSEYELSLLRQRGLAARDSKALRGELQFILPPGYFGTRLDRLRWTQTSASAASFVSYSTSSRSSEAPEWRPAAYHTVLMILRHPVYAGDYVFGRTTRARMSSTAARAGPPAIPSR